MRNTGGAAQYSSRSILLTTASTMISLRHSDQGGECIIAVRAAQNCSSERVTQLSRWRDGVWDQGLQQTAEMLHGGVRHGSGIQGCITVPDAPARGPEIIDQTFHGVFVPSHRSSGRRFEIRQHGIPTGGRAVNAQSLEK